jgi:hypothetical protein
MVSFDQSSSFSSSKSSFWGNWLYCPARNNPSQLSFPASLFIDHKSWYYVKLRSPFRNDIKRRLYHYLKKDDIFTYPGGFIKMVSKNTVEIYDVLNHNEPIGSVVYRSRSKKRNI